MRNNQFLYLLRYCAIAGNILFLLWITYNGITEGFQGTIYQKLSYAGLSVLLLLNSYFLLRRGK